MPIALGECAHACAARDEDAQALVDWKSYKDTGSLAARNRLVTRYMSTLVRPIAARIHGGLPRQVELEDLIQQGYLGLVDAMDRYALERETRFSAFARPRIFGAVHDYLRSLDPAPRLFRTRVKRLRRAQERFQKEHGRPPSEDELRPMVDMPSAALRRCLSEPPAAIVSFSHTTTEPGLGDESDTDAMDGFEDGREVDPLVSAARGDLQHWVIRSFDDRDRLIITLYYYEGLTMGEIGRTIGISESRVSQRLDLIVARLRARLVPVCAEPEFAGLG